MLLTRDEYIDCIRRSGLVEEERLNRFLQDPAAQSGDVLEIARNCVETGILTDWQRERLLEKKWRGFFIGKYKILYPLGAGAMGSVFLAEHKVMRQRVALKVLAKRLASRPSNVARFEREARAAAVVNHPNVVRAFDIDRDGDTHYLVMEYVQGENLQKIVQTNGPVDPKLAANYTAQIARGLNEAHKNGMIHRDIKPANVLLDLAGVVKILDLGLARINDDEAPSLTIANDTKMIGTVDYLAPEQAINSHTIDGRADIYSLGCSLYFLLTGLPPFPTGSLTERILKHQSRRPLDIRKRRPGVPDELVNICSRMMEKQAARRYQTAGEAADALQAFFEGRLDDIAIDETNRAIEDSDSGINSLAEDSSAGRSGMGSNSTAGRSLTSKSGMPNVNGNAASSMNGRSLGANVRDGHKSNVAGQSLGASKSIASSASIAAEKSSVSKSFTNTVVDDLDLTPVETPSPKRSGSGSIASKSLGSSSAAKSGVTEKPTPAAKGTNSPAALAPLSVIDDLPPPLAAPAEQSIFDAPLDATGPLVAGAAALSPLGNSPLGNSALGNPPSLLDAMPLATAKSPQSDEPGGHSSATNQLLAKAMRDVEEENEGNFNYSLWFLIASGLIISLILIVVAFSYAKSFQKDELNKQALENNKPF